jgi:hypothetical protein
MWRKILLAAALSILSLRASPQDIMEQILYLTGASAPEELDAEVMERWSALAARPVRINLATEARLASCGLFSRYQAASVADYRRSAGDILSVAELALLDGFGEETARALAPFVSFETRARPGRSSLDKGMVTTEVLTRGILQESEGEGSGNYALKVRTGDEERWLASAAAKKAAGASFWPQRDLSGSVAVYGRRLPFELVLGDFNARFGQGLLLWSGFSLSGVQSAAAMDRHPSGLSPAWTLSPGSAHRGAAAGLTLGRFVLSGFWSYGKCSGANLTWLARCGQLGLTAVDAGRASADWRWSFGRWDIFGEVAEDFRNRVTAGVAGVAWNPAYRVRLAASVRGYPAAFDGSLAGALRSSTRSADERGAALAFDYKALTLTADVAVHPSKGSGQCKAVVKYAPQVTDFLSFTVRAVSRYRPQDTYMWRNELRAEAVLASPGGLSLKGCAAACRSAGLSWLAYLEPGYKIETDNLRWSLYIRGTAFVVDDWEDRIYIYERDIRGAFSVPAYYGRGCSLSAVTSLKVGEVTLGARAFATAWPGMAEKKPGKAGLKFQCMLTF